MEIIAYVEIKEIISSIKSTFSNSFDIFAREFTVGDKSCAYMFIDGESDKQLLEQDVLRPLLHIDNFYPPYLDKLQQLVNYSEQIKMTTVSGAPDIIAQGDIVFFIDNEDVAYVFSIRKFDKRAISEPPTASVLKGPREGFIEEIKTNIAMVRRRIKSPKLVVKNLQIGRYSVSTVAVLYINGIACQDVVDDLTKKLEAIDIDGIIDSTYITSFIESHKYSIFNQAGTTEKPDIVAAKLLEGRIAIMVDGTPIVITVPYLLLEDLQDGYDYYSNDWRATMIRIFRFIGAMLTVLLPGAYVALQSYHTHLLPLKFLITLLSATTDIPFPPAIEMLVVLTLFEVLNQASIRMPRFMGISLSIVGAIVLGDTAVKSGLISSPAVLVTALSAIGIFCVPDQVGTLSILRLLFLCASAVLGFLGILILLILTIGYLVSLENFGTPYLAPFAPRISPDLKDALFKDSVSSMKQRPYSIPTKNRTRLSNNNFKEVNRND
ncbi:MAG: spore germination protein [Clostridia bacterium]